MVGKASPWRSFAGALNVWSSAQTRSHFFLFYWEAECKTEKKQRTVTTREEIRSWNNTSLKASVWCSYNIKSCMQVVVNSRLNPECIRKCHLCVVCRAVSGVKLQSAHSHVLLLEAFMWCACMGLYQAWWAHVITSCLTPFLLKNLQRFWSFQVLNSLPGTPRIGFRLTWLSSEFPVFVM